MPAVKIQKFIGAAPKISPELLPDSAAQVASNIKLYSGDLLPYHGSTVVGNVQRNGEIKAIYPLRDPVTNDKLWLSWLNDVNVAVTTSTNDEEQRIYYTGDGAPKVTNYDLAYGDGTGPFPMFGYQLGLPLPTLTPSVTVESFTGVVSTSYSRDAGNIATITTATPHNLKDGNVVSVSGFTTDEAKLFNATNVSVTVVSPTAFTYYNAGAAVSTVSDSSGRVNLAGTTVSRGYVYTWVTPWGEESIPSEPTDLVYVKEGQKITVSGLPTAPPDGTGTTWFIRGIRIYRTVTSTSGTTYFRLRTIWFSNEIVAASRTANLVTAYTNSHHNLSVGDRIKITNMAFGGVADTSFNVSGTSATHVVDSVIDDTTFTYIAAGSNKAKTATTAGTLFWDIAENDSPSYRYYESNSFIDDYDVNTLALTLDSTNADAPAENMQGLVAAQNNILVGFVGNELCFSEPSKPWSWPIRYRLVFESEIVAIAPVAGSILVLTNKYPYIVSGSTPANMSSSRIDAPYPCTSKRGVVNIGYGVIFPTYGGLGVYSPNSGIDFITKLVHDWDTWNPSLDPSTVVAAFYAGKYFASHSAGSFVFEREDKIGGFFVDTSITFSTAYYDSTDNKFYYISDQSGTLSEWDDPTAPLQPMEWKSKVIVTKDYLNLGAARVVADYSTPSEDTEANLAFNETVPIYNAAVWLQVTQFGTINGPVPLSITDPDPPNGTILASGCINSFQINGDPYTKVKRAIAGEYPINFKLWANKELVCDVVISNSDVFRLPTGYRSDTFEVSVSGSARVRSIHLGETPFGLRAA